ncbi:hypothetical protein BST81_07635 [Leptolyngbya sp. 'hensonii']|uniref:response regulator n=1 Tax=Leptolyngbya sp. 'hensonii' TaxID=1922337 RepID=UPI00095025C6|nr:response regulator [Leptolyngbya sp. 'hensonii']OLP19074.1 hypothetical protein BST81_07635 [Leptolyngbya sp. 'hensonii']
MRILLVEDDQNIAGVLTDALTEQRYAVDVARDGQEGLDLAESVNYDLILMDVGLPKLDGLSLCRKLRAKNYHMPILLLTARDTSNDKIMGLDAGADDYVVKPFNIAELAARIRALLRRGEVPSSPILQWGDLCLDPTTCQVTYGSQSLPLSPKEYSLLELFLRNNRRVFSRSAILDHLWSFDDSPGEDTVKAHIKGLRQKLRAVGAADLIETVYGLGYRLRELDSLQKPAPTVEKAPGSPKDEATQTTRQAKTQVAVTQAWLVFKPSLLERVTVLEQAIEKLHQGQLTDELRYQAAREAHKLAGSAGMFGFHGATKLARSLEEILEAESSPGPDQATKLGQQIATLRHQLDSPPGESEIDPSAWAQPTTSKQANLLVVTTDRQLIQNLTQIPAADFRITAASSVSVARDLIRGERPDLALVDLTQTEMGEAALPFVGELTACAPPVPTLTLTIETMPVDRVEIARLGGRPLLSHALDLNLTLDLLRQVHQKTRSSATRILVVDDDPIILTTLQQLLEPWGFQVATLADPLQFDAILEAVNPELVVLDVEMPQRDGIELCQTIRNHAQLNWLPILFLTARNDAETIRRVFAAGADDFISKPITGPELLTRMHNRLERTRLIRNLAEIDPLTGAANQQKSMQELQRFCIWSDRYHHPWTLAVLDLDHFNQLNDQHTHAVGDRVLHWLGKLLKQTFRSEDIIARWGGAAFVIGMYGMSAPEGMERLNEVLRLLKRQAFSGPKTPFQVTFSAGISEYPNHGQEIPDLYRSAMAALTRAKADGGERIYPVGEPI